MGKPIDFDYIFLFFITPALLHFRHKFEHYEGDEPGYANNWIRAYLEAFNEPSTKPLSTDLIKRIHKVAMAHDTAIAGSKYKSKPNQYSVIFPISKTPDSIEEIISWNATRDGLSEFMKFWLIDNPHPVHKLEIRSQADANIGFSLEDQTWYTHPSNPATPPHIFNSESELTTVYRLAEEVQYHVSIHSLQNVHKGAYSETVSKMMEQLITDYNRDIAAAKSGDSKLKIIVSTVMHMYQLQPFQENRANFRTSYILLNKLLTDNGLTSTLLMNPERLGGCSVYEMVEMVKHGQTFVTQILHNEEEEYSLLTSSDIESNIKMQRMYPRREKMNGVSKQLILDFVKTVLMKNQPVNPALDNKTKKLQSPSRTRVSLFTSITEGVDDAEDEVPKNDNCVIL